MSGLVLKLGPSERILINGVVIENGARRSRLNILTPDANILRLRDAIHPRDATTPVRRLCYAAQLVLSGDRRIDEVTDELLTGIEELSYALRDRDSHENLSEARRAVAEGQPYRVLKALRRLLEIEDALLPPAAS